MRPFMYSCVSARKPGLGISVQYGNEALTGCAYAPITYPRRGSSHAGFLTSYTHASLRTPDQVAKIDAMSESVTEGSSRKGYQEFRYTRLSRSQRLLARSVTLADRCLSPADDAGPTLTSTPVAEKVADRELRSPARPDLRRQGCR